jgi:phosphinothricin acetyltransferase
MLAVVGDSDNQGSLRLHEALGFEHVGCARAVGFKFGRWLDVVTLQLPLGPGSAAPPVEMAEAQGGTSP